MTPINPSTRVLVPLIGLLAAHAAAADTQISYTRQIKPILANKCFACHGPDEQERKAELRLDRRDDAIASAIHAGKPDDSDLLLRITTDDADLQMPPPGSKKPAVTEEEAMLIARWIEQGAQYDAHWAYVQPTRPSPPEVTNKNWPINPIDQFILAKLEAANLAPAPEADARTLVRRLSFDLTGLPPSPEEVEAFTAASIRNPQSAIRNFTDQLLASPHFGERLAQYWLDVVRYADTGGYHSDNHRDVWAYRDYVISAFNSNKPYDQFTIEQLAGDLLPNATDEQRIASGFNRLLQTTEEGGAQPKEYAAKYAADRVRNTSVIWLASTMGCCECHTHKYDPFTIKDFYSFAAFFADIGEKHVGRQIQNKLPTPEQLAEIKDIDAALAAAKAALTSQTPPLDEPEIAAQREKIASIEKARAALDAKLLSTLVSVSIEPRTMRILPRGNWLDDSGDVVEPAIPEFLASVGNGLRAVPSPANKTGIRVTRLDLANWIVARDHPLTARVFVNRLWKLVFGRGIVKTGEDFGSQGELPTHPELLDWLAIEFQDSGWDVKHLLKLMVMSHTYRQSSLPTKESLATDPANELFSRQNRFRLDAEIIRDNALAVSGLLVPTIGGPSVKPYQPAGYWQYLNFPTRQWHNDLGPNQYRRGLYTYWQRTFLHPSLAAFDAPSREECTVDRPRSNTPQQALVLLNDPTYVEAARALAVRIMQSQGQSPTQRINFAVYQVLSRLPLPDEAAELSRVYEKHYGEFAANPESVQQLVAVGDLKTPDTFDPVDLAAWTSVSRVLLNLHEAITRY